VRGVDVADKEAREVSRSTRFVPRCDEVSTSTSDDLRCPHCAAHVTAAAEWCTLCYADLRTPIIKPATDEPESKPEPAAASVDALLAQLANAESGNPLGRLSSVVDTPAKKVGLMVGGAVAAMCLLFILMAVVGALL